MKHRFHLIAGALATTIALTCAVGASLAQEIIPAALPQLENTAMADSTGVVLVPENELVDFIVPTELNGDQITSIGPSAMEGCEAFRTVTVPKQIEDIGANAFANCPNLETVYMLERADDSDMTLGENWSGTAEVIYEYSFTMEADAVESADETTSEEGSERTETPVNSEETVSENTETAPSEEAATPQDTEPSATSPEPPAQTTPAETTDSQPSDAQQENPSEVPTESSQPTGQAEADRQEEVLAP